MPLSEYKSAKLRDAAAAGMWMLPHDLRRSIYLQANGDKRDLFELMRNHELGEVPGQLVSIKGFDRHKCIFVHVPKCAGISIGRALFGSYEGNHMGIPTYQVIFSKQEFESYFKLTCVRNPWDRLVSAYHYMLRGSDLNFASAADAAKMNGSGPQLSANELIKMHTASKVREFADFEQFVKVWVTPENARVHEHFRPQHRFLASPRGRVELDYIARFETIDEDMPRICDRLGIEATLGHHNRTVGDRLSYREYYTPETRRIVADLYRKDIEMFGYSFNG